MYSVCEVGILVYKVHTVGIELRMCVERLHACCGTVQCVNSLYNVRTRSTLYVQDVRCMYNVYTHVVHMYSVCTFCTQCVQGVHSRYRPYDVCTTYTRVC